MTCLTAPVTHFAIVLAPGMDGVVANCNLSPASSLAFEVEGFVHVVVDVATDAGDSIGGGESFGAAIHGQSFSLERLPKGTDTTGDLGGFGVVGAEVLNFALQGGVVLLFQGPVYQVSELHALCQ